MSSNCTEMAKINDINNEISFRSFPLHNQRCRRRALLKTMSIQSKQERIQDSPEDGAPTLQGVPTYDFANFSKKLHESIISKLCTQSMYTNRLYCKQEVSLSWDLVSATTAQNQPEQLKDDADRRGSHIITLK